MHQTSCAQSAQKLLISKEESSVFPQSFFVCRFTAAFPFPNMEDRSYHASVSAQTAHARCDARCTSGVSVQRQNASSSHPCIYWIDIWPTYSWTILSRKQYQMHRLEPYRIHHHHA